MLVLHEKKRVEDENQIALGKFSDVEEMKEKPGSINF
jgi:hypothetical protein